MVMLCARAVEETVCIISDGPLALGDPRECMANRRG